MFLSLLDVPSPPHSCAADGRWMFDALSEARRGLGRTHPNPAVGAVLIRDGQVIGRGFHSRAGSPHAEVEALRSVAGSAAGSTLYVTLEPCDHHGRTPPCTEAILRAGIARVVVGAVDPNPQVSGRGIQRLRAAGVQVDRAPPDAVRACEALIVGFASVMTRGRPWVVLKAAASLDGRIATRTGDSRWISCPQSRARVHAWRDSVDAVLVGAGTVRADRPALTTRLDAPAEHGRPPRTPWRIVVAGDHELDPRTPVFDTSLGPVVVAVRDPLADWVRRIEDRGCRILPVDRHPSGPMASLLHALAGLGLTSVLVEGGGAIHASILREDLCDEVRWFLAPRLAGADAVASVGPLGVDLLAHWPHLSIEGAERIGVDLLVTAGRRHAGEP